MVKTLRDIVAWFRQLWNRLDEKAKRQIIDEIIKAFEELLRAFYQEWKKRREP